MPDIIQQLLDLKEWSQDSARYERRMNFRVGQLVQPGPGRPGYAGDDHHSFKPLETATEKAHYKRLYGKKYNVDDWRSGNFEIKGEFSSGKKKVGRMVSNLRAEFRQSLSKYLSRAGELNKLNKRGYVSVGQLNTILGRKDTQDAIDGLGRALSGKRPSAWLDEIPGVKKLKKSKLGKNLVKIEGGGKVFYKMPPKETIKGLKSYYKNQEYLSDFKYGKIKGDTIKNVQTLYDNEVLMKAIKQWSTKDEVPLKIIESVFGDGMTGPNSVMQLGKALKGDIKVPGVKKNVALGNKIIEAMAWQAGKKRGSWPQAMYEYAKGEMETLYKLHGKEWSFGKYYNETRNLLNKLGAKGVIDEVSSLRSGWTNNNQIYSTFKQVIDGKINDSFKSGYDGNFSESQFKVQEALKKGDYDEVARLTGLQEGSYKRAKLKYPKVEFATFGEFDKATGKFSKPEAVFGERFKELPSQIQKGIRKSFRETGVSLNVGQTRTQEELFKNTLNRVKKELPDIYKAYRANGIGKGCPIPKAEGGRIGFFKAGAVDDCMGNAIQEHNKNLKSNDEVIRNEARAKQFNINKTKNMKNILSFGTKAATSPWRLLGGRWGALLEGVFEGAFYEWGRRQGQSHEEARENYFFPKIIEKMVPDTIKDTELWKKYGIKPFKAGILEGPEGLIEEELKGTNEVVRRYMDNENALYEARNKYRQLSNAYNVATTGRERNPERAEQLMTALEDAWEEMNRIEDQMDLDKDTYQAAVEKQQTERGKVAQDYGYYGEGQTERFIKDTEDRRQREMEDLFPGYGKAQIDQKLEEAGYTVDPNLTYKKVKDPWLENYGKNLIDISDNWDYGTVGDYFKDKDKMAYFAENFRTEKARGGIAGLSGGKRFGPPPLSGPDPQGEGLFSQYNRVKKLTG